MSRKADDVMDSSEYVRHVLDAYRAAPGTHGAIRKPDRAFALQLFARGVPLAVVENALLLAVLGDWRGQRMRLRCADPLACLLSGH